MKEGRLTRENATAMRAVSRPNHSDAEVRLALDGNDRTCMIYLLRHGSTDYNAAGRLMGHLDIPVARKGELEALAAARALTGRGITTVYASDLKRAHTTALLVAQHLGLTVTTCPALREINMGEWEGHTMDEAARLDPSGYAAVQADPVHCRPSGGESEGQLIERLWAALGDIARDHAGEKVLVVSHGGPLRAITGRVLGAGYVARGAFAFANCAFMLLEWGPDGQRLTVPGPVVEQPTGDSRAL